MPESESRKLPMRKVPPSLTVAFWVWFFLGSIVVIISVIGAASSLSLFDEKSFLPLAIIAVAYIFYPAWAYSVVWRAGRDSSKSIRWISRSAALIVWTAFVLLPVGYIWWTELPQYGLRAKLSETLVISAPHRTAIEIACEEKTLRAGMSTEELGLDEPSKYKGSLTRSVTIEVESETKARVVISLKEIENLIGDEERIFYSGTCGPNGVSWETGGTIQKKHWPRI